MIDKERVLSHLRVIRTWAAVGTYHEGIEKKCCEDVTQWADEALELMESLLKRREDMDSDEGTSREHMRNIWNYARVNEIGWMQNAASDVDITLNLMANEIFRLRQQQEPRVLTIGEMLSGMNVDVYIEYNHEEIVYPLMLLATENSTKSRTAYFMPNTARSINTYGKVWRCWTSRPSDKQRKEEKWDD